MKRKDRKLARKQKLQGKKRSRLTRTKTNARKHYRARRRKPVVLGNRVTITDPRIARGLGVMRREGASASEAARRERMKLKTFRKGAGKYLYRPRPGKPYKARSEDQLRFSMTILTSHGPMDVIVPNSRERKLLHRYNLAVNMFRSSDDRAEAALAEAALKEFEGETVAGHVLITDINQLIQLEEADQIDVENFYTPLGGRS
jgi:hypothetical protein